MHARMYASTPQLADFRFLIAILEEKKKNQRKNRNFVTESRLENALILFFGAWLWEWVLL